MNQPQSTQSIVTGIDGSNTAINAAKWAVAEATSRGLPLRLVHVIEDKPDTTPVGSPDLAIEYAETVLREADAALHATGEPVKVETAIAYGSSMAALIDESRDAAMICVGSVGIGRCSRMLLGSTATALAQGAHCPVAILRTDRGGASAPHCGWVVVPVDDSPGDEALLEHGFREAQLRNAPMLALEVQPWEQGPRLDERLRKWISRYPDVHIRPTPIRHGAVDFLSNTEEPIQLAIVGGIGADTIARIVGPVTGKFPDQAGCSVLVVRA